MPCIRGRKKIRSHSTRELISELTGSLIKSVTVEFTAGVETLQSIKMLQKNYLLNRITRTNTFDAVLIRFSRTFFFFLKLSKVNYRILFKIITISHKRIGDI